jgi:hypothetical protein
MQIGSFQYTRPDYPVRHSDIEHVLAVSGKEIIRVAWSALAPFECKHFRPQGSCSRGPYGRRYCTRQIVKEDLAAWFCQFFNLERDCGQGTACINQLASLGLLTCARCVSAEGIFSNDFYVPCCAPAFNL